MDGESPRKNRTIFLSVFVSAKEDNKNAPEGLGFGLSCVKNIIETMGGEISLKSGEEGGSCFTVRIPPL